MKLKGSLTTRKRSERTPNGVEEDEIHAYLHLPIADYYTYCFRIPLPVLQSSLAEAEATCWIELGFAARRPRPAARPTHPSGRHRWTDPQGHLRAAMPAKVIRRNPFSSYLGERLDQSSFP